ncbi:uncharacterized protein Gm50595 isoform X1 [Mus musculus]|uniref:uncharacterized protein Gm50595 isoform X1 n=1 Tax=Mus musculus TaxID=10090 RepID=UPI0007EC439A|nr:uncharacterized protein Gm50595 isoform X1 [Mus musculus]|eukprot:XP_017174865.1 PREDICTED: uncharacterized protein LOC108168771 isoform X1 [Mus musculus]
MNSERPVGERQREERPDKRKHFPKGFETICFFRFLAFDRAVQILPMTFEPFVFSFVDRFEYIPKPRGDYEPHQNSPEEPYLCWLWRTRTIQAGKHFLCCFWKTDAGHMSTGGLSSHGNHIESQRNMSSAQEVVKMEPSMILRLMISSQKDSDSASPVCYLEKPAAFSVLRMKICKAVQILEEARKRKRAEKRKKISCWTWIDNYLNKRKDTRVDDNRN